MRKLSLRAKLLLLFLAIALIPPIVTGIIGVSITSDLTRQRVIVDEQARLNSLSIEVERFLDTTLSDIRLLAGSNTMVSLSEAIRDRENLQLQRLRSEVEQEFINFQAERQIGDQLVYEHIRFLNMNGYEFVRIDETDGEVRAVSGVALNTRAHNAYFRDALPLPEGQILVSPILIFDEFGRIPEDYVPVMRYSMPIRAGEETVGVLVTDVRADGFLNLVTSQSTPDSLTYMIDQTGMYIAHPDESRLFGDVLETGANVAQDQPELLFLLQGDDLSYSELQDSLVFYRTIRPRGASSFYWTLVSERPLESIFTIARQQAGVIVVAVVLIAALVALAALLISRAISRPIVALTEAAQSIAGGKYDQQVQVTSQDEIGTLQQSVNTMASQIKQSIDTLEERVRERTVELEEARQVAEAANSAKTEFLSNMSHELRTPLNMVIGYTSSMLTMPQMYDYVTLPEIYRKDISTIQENGQHLLGLINDILDLSKIEAGKLDMQNQIINLTEIFKGVIATSVGLIKDKPLQIRPNYPESLPPAWGDPMRIRQILLNLLSNAIKFTDTGYVTLTAAVNGERVDISVTDTGMGIPEESLQVIFDRFAQIQSKASIQGTGLGLDITQRLVQMHGGTLKAESRLGVGSRFSFSLPLATAEQMPQPEAQPELSETPPTQPEAVDWTAYRTILLVADDSYLRSTLHRVLEEANYVVFETSQPNEVQEFATSLTVDLIVLDADLSQRNDFDLLADLKAHEATAAIPLILLTGEAGLNGAASGIPQTPRKPLRAGDLLAKIQRELMAVPSND